MKRVETIGRVSRHVSNNVTRDVFGGKSFKKKQCTCCGEWKLYSDFYTKPNKQHIHPSQIVSKDLRDYCIVCYDEKNKSYNKGSRPRSTFSTTLENFFCNEV